jgi:hypothetical protein
MYSLLSALKGTQTTSVRGLQKALSSKRTNVVQLVQTHQIHDFYTKQQRSKGPLGYPIGEVQFQNGKAIRHYRGGEVHTMAGTAGGVLLREVKVMFGGFKCIKESSHDQLSDTDEPYFVVSVGTTGGMIPITKKFGHYENVETDTKQTINEVISTSLNPNPLMISVDAYEHDYGDPDETAKAIQDEMVKLAQAAQSLLAATEAADAADGPGIGPTAGAAGAAGTLAGPVGAVIAGAIVTVMDLGDDYIGHAGAAFFTRAYDIGDTPIEPKKLGDFPGMDTNRGYNAVIDIDGKGEGKYQLYFDIAVEIKQKPLPG